MLPSSAWFEGGHSGFVTVNHLLKFFSLKNSENKSLRVCLVTVNNCELLLRIT
jgi:hypothetical protein